MSDGSHASSTATVISPRPAADGTEAMALERALWRKLDAAARTRQAEPSAWQRTALLEGVRSSVADAGWRA